jgi:hypothetical protein
MSRFLTPEEAALALGTSVAEVRELHQRNVLYGSRFLGELVFEQAAVAAYRRRIEGR